MTILKALRKVGFFIWSAICAVFVIIHIGALFNFIAYGFALMISDGPYKCAHKYLTQTCEYTFCDENNCKLSHNPCTYYQNSMNNGTKVPVCKAADLFDYDSPVYHNRWWWFEVSVAILLSGGLVIWIAHVVENHLKKNGFTWPPEWRSILTANNAPVPNAPPPNQHINVVINQLNGGHYAPVALDGPAVNNDNQIELV